MKNTTLCYLEKDGCWLMMNRNKKEQDENAGKWIGVGGKCEEGESPEDCLVREVREETGLTLNTFCYRGLVTFASDCYPTEYMHLFTSSSFTGAPFSDCAEGTLCFIEKSRVFQLPLWEGDQVFLKMLLSEGPFFSLKLCYEGERLTRCFLNGAPYFY